MRALKYIAIFFMIMVIVSLLLVGYFFATASVSIVAYKAKGATYADIPEQLERIITSVENKTFIGTLFSSEPLNDPEDYVLITYTVRLSNQCLVPIDMIEIQIVPNPTDVLQLGDQDIRSLNPKSIGDFTATIMARKDSHSVREIIITYYVWGVSFSVKETYRE